MSSSNIFMQMVTGLGPVVGEGLLEGWQGSVELKSFEWGMQAQKQQSKTKPGMAGAARSLAGVGPTIDVKMQALRFVKRFDVGSAQIHACLDNHKRVLSCSITVLHMQAGDRMVHQPGFMLTAADGYISEVEVDMVQTSSGVELIETVSLNFKEISMVYLKKFGKDNLPTLPFMHGT